MQQRGQGQCPIFLIPARMTLHILSESTQANDSNFPYLLFRVICGICEYAGVKATFDSVMACNNDAMFVCFDEFIVKKNLHLLVEKFSTAVSNKGLFGTSSPNVFCSKVLELVGQLNNCVGTSNQKINMSTYLFKIGHMGTQMVRGLASTIFGFITKKEVAWPEVRVAKTSQVS